MIDYQRMYATMFHATTDALTILNRYLGSNCHDVIECIAILSAAQEKCEDIYIESSDEKRL